MEALVDLLKGLGVTFKELFRKSVDLNQREKNKRSCETTNGENAERILSK